MFVDDSSMLEVFRAVGKMLGAVSPQAIVQGLVNSTRV